MMLFSFLAQIFSLIIGSFLAKSISNRYSSSLTFENAYVYSKLFIFISFGSLVLILLGGVSLQFDAFCLYLPLLYQKYSMFITWFMIVVYLAFLSGFALYVTSKVKKEKFRVYFFALMVMNVLLFINHYQKNTYGGDAVKEKAMTPFVKQSTNYSCTSASIATIAQHFEIYVTEKKIAQLSRLTKLGANSGQVRFALNALGISYHSLTGKSNNPKYLHAPAILYVDNPVVGYEGHAIVYLGKNRYGYEIWNPVGFKIYLSEEELKEIWHGMGEECSFSQ